MEQGLGGPWLGESLWGRQGWGAAIAVDDRACAPSATPLFVRHPADCPRPDWQTPSPPPFPSPAGARGGGRAICGLLLRLLLESPAQTPGSTSGELTPPRLQQTFAERPGAGDTPVPAATSPPPGKQREADSPSLPGRAKDKTDRERRRGSSWEKLDCFAHSRLPTPPPRRPSGHEYPWESESAAGPCCHPQPDPVGGKADQRGHCSQS